MAKIPALPKPPGQRKFNLAVQRHPATLYRENYNLLPTTETPAREGLYFPTPKGIPAQPKQVKPPTLPAHWSGK
jgi:hypothetical protein